MSEECKIVDAHSHLGINPGFGMYSWRWPEILKHMDVCKVDLIIQAHQSAMGCDWNEGISESISAYENSGRRIYAYAPFNPNDLQAESRISSALDNPAFIGIKLHPSFHGIHGDDEAYRPAWELAKKFKVPVLTHSYDRTAARASHQLSWVMLFEKWLAEYPEVPLILGHSGGLPKGHREAVELAKRYHNAYLDLAGDTFTYNFIEWIVGQIGDDRFLYGSDLDWIDTRNHLYRVIAADIPENSKRKILGENAIKLFQLNSR